MSVLLFIFWVTLLFILFIVFVFTVTFPCVTAGKQPEKLAAYNDYWMIECFSNLLKLGAEYRFDYHSRYKSPQGAFLIQMIYHYPEIALAF